MTSRKRVLPYSSLSWKRAIARSPVRLALVGIMLLLLWLGHTTLRLYQAAHHPIDAVLLLGGSIRREIHAAEQSHQSPDRPILIAHGSEDPCIRLIFERAGASLENVWLEKCSESTFENFFFCTPILQQWQVRKVRLITSESHLPRALWLARILLGAQGIWVEPDIVAEEGVPGNQESWLKTSLDITRSLAWAIASQVYQPRCGSIVRLSTVDLAWWRQRGFKCEHQANLDL